MTSRISRLKLLILPLLLGPLLMPLAGCSQTGQPIVQLNPSQQTPRQQIAGYATLYTLADVGISIAHATGKLTGSGYATAQTDLVNEGKAIATAQAWLAANPALADTPGVQYPATADIILTPLLNNFALAAPLLPPAPPAPPATTAPAEVVPIPTP